MKTRSQSKTVTTFTQHYPPGTQEDNNSFSSRNLAMGKGKELEFPEGRGGCQGSEVALRHQPYCAKRNGAATQSGVPPTVTSNEINQSNYFEDTYNFDEASSAWRANKRSNGNGSFRYICAGTTRTGRPCRRTTQLNLEFCMTHSTVESDAPYKNTRSSASLRSKW
jgi:hypothetical protein